MQVSRLIEFHKLKSVYLSVIVAALVVAEQPCCFANEGNTVGQRRGISNNEIVIGSCAPLSGQQKIRGTQLVSGGRAYFSYINEKGGVNGRKIKLLTCDDHYNVNEGAVTCFNGCLKGKVFAGALFQGTAGAVKYVQLADLRQMPMVGFSTGGDFITNPVHPYAFQIRATYNDEAAEQVNVLWKKLGLRRMAILYQSDAYGVACRRGILDALTKVGGTPVAEVSYERLSRNLDEQVRLLRESKPQVVIIGGGGDAVSIAVKARKQIADDLLMVSFSSSSDLLTEGAGEQADGSLLSEVLPLANTDLATVQLYKKCAAKYEHEDPSYSGFEGFLIGITIVEGLKRAGRDLTRDGFVKALESIRNLDIGLGNQFKLNFTAQQHDGLRGQAFMAVIKDGKIEPVTDWRTLISKASNPLVHQSN